MKVMSVSCVGLHAGQSLLKKKIYNNIKNMKYLAINRINGKDGTLKIRKIKEKSN